MNNEPENIPSGGLQSPPANVPDRVFEDIFKDMFAEPPKSAPLDIPLSGVYHDLKNHYTRKKRRFLQEKSEK